MQFAVLHVQREAAHDVGFGDNHALRTVLGDVQVGA